MDDRGYRRRWPQGLTAFAMLLMPLAGMGDAIIARHFEERSSGQDLRIREEIDRHEDRQGGIRGKRVRMRADRFLVQLDGDFEKVSQVFSGLGLEVVDRLPFSPVFSIRFPDEGPQAYGRLLARLKQLGRRHGFRVTRDYLAGTAAVPNDPAYASLQKDLAVIGAPAAWDLTTGSAETVVVIIDSGMDMDHPDLAMNLYSSPFEIPDNELDDDGNGLVDDVNGWDFFANDNLPEDSNGHGTAMAGIIGAVGNNGVGIAGTAWTCQLLPLRAGDAQLPWTAIIQALDYAVWLKENGVPVAAINNSYGGPISDPSELQVLSDALDRVEAAGMLFVAAAGNNGWDLDDPSDESFYPASLPHDNILALAATDNSDALSTSSNYGEISVDMAGPGVSIHSTGLAGGYQSYTGTSASCARASGVAALLHALNGNLSTGQMKALLIDNATVAVDLVGKLFNPVRLAADESLVSVQPFPLGSWSVSRYFLAIPEGSNPLLEVTATDPDGQVVSVEFLVNGLSLGTDTDGVDGWTWNWNAPTSSGSLQFRITDSDGNTVTSPVRPFAILSEFDYWRHGHWGFAFDGLDRAAESADPDRDGLSNIWEYALAGNPLIGNLRLRTSDSSLELFLETSGDSLNDLWGETPGDFFDIEPDPLFPGFQRVRIGLETGSIPNPLFIRAGLRLTPQEATSASYGD